VIRKSVLAEDNGGIMNTIVNKFVQAHDRYMELERIRTECTNPAQRESVHIAILTAYLEVQFHARQIAGLQYADGMDFADVN
jgi:hypothetical protein